MTRFEARAARLELEWELCRLTAIQRKTLEAQFSLMAQLHKLNGARKRKKPPSAQPLAQTSGACPVFLATDSRGTVRVTERNRGRAPSR